MLSLTRSQSMMPSLAPATASVKRSCDRRSASSVLLAVVDVAHRTGHAVRLPLLVAQAQRAHADPAIACHRRGARGIRTRRPASRLPGGRGCLRRAAARRRGARAATRPGRRAAAAPAPAAGPAVRAHAPTRTPCPRAGPSPTRRRRSRPPPTHNAPRIGAATPRRACARRCPTPSRPCAAACRRHRARTCRARAPSGTGCPGGARAIRLRRPASGRPGAPASLPRAGARLRGAAPRSGTTRRAAAPPAPSGMPRICRQRRDANTRWLT